MKQKILSKHRRLAMTTLLVLAAAVFGRQAIVAQASDTTQFVQALGMAQAASKAKDWATAIPLWENVVKANPVNPTYWQILANISYQAKDYKKAISAYQKMIELGGGLPSNAAYNIACSYALLGDQAAATKWLQTAFSMGFRDLPLAQKDADLASLHDLPEFQRLVGQIDTSKMSRVEGWRYDLQFFAGEVHRKGFGVYRRATPAEFDMAVKLLSDKIPDLTDIEVMIEMSKLAALVGDGHTTIALSPPRLDLLKTLPMQFYLFEEGLFVVATDPKYKDLLGAQVVRFGDKSVDDVITALTPMINRDQSSMWIKTRAPYLMRSLPILAGLKLIPGPERVDLTIRDKDGKNRSVTVEADMSQPNIWNVLPNPDGWLNVAQTTGGPIPLYLQNNNKRYWFDYQPNTKTLYFQYNVIQDANDEPIDKFAVRLSQFVESHDVDKFVVDMRWNNGGNTVKNKPILELLANNRKINQKGKLFIVIGRRVFSAAQNAVSQFEANTDAIFIGEPTGSSPNFVGDEIFFTLPYSKLRANVSDIYWQYAGPFDHRIWTAPQIYLPPRFADLHQGRDPIMEAIEAYRQDK